MKYVLLHFCLEYGTMILVILEAPTANKPEEGSLRLPSALRAALIGCCGSPETGQPLGVLGLSTSAKTWGCSAPY